MFAGSSVLAWKCWTLVNVETAVFTSEPRLKYKTNMRIMIYCELFKLLILVMPVWFNHLQPFTIFARRIQIWVPNSFNNLDTDLKQIVSGPQHCHSAPPEHRHLIIIGCVSAAFCPDKDRNLVRKKNTPNYVDCIISMLVPDSRRRSRWPRRGRQRRSGRVRRHSRQSQSRSWCRWSRPRMRTRTHSPCPDRAKSVGWFKKNSKMKADILKMGIWISS
jgi:hypothetical protein